MGTFTTPSGFTYNTEKQRYTFTMGAAYQYIFQNTASWWIDFTLDRLISERWILKLENWPFGVYVQAYLMGQYSSTT